MIMTTVADMVREAQAEILETDLTPQRTAELLSRMTALMGNANEDRRISEAEYNVVLFKCKEVEGSAAGAKMRAACSPEWLRRQEAQDRLDEVTELIRSLKVLLRGQQEEARHAR